MCGIAGIISLGPVPVEDAAVRAMTDAIRHRGPDGEGIVRCSANVVFGHRRLKVLDLSDSNAQPMETEDGRFTITYNGEIYNFSALRQELVARGHKFKTRGDTEVVLRSWVEWGPASLGRFNGMFAFGIHDSHSQTTFLARDRYGIKPLYVSVLPDRIVFASEQAGVKAAAGLNAELDLYGLLEYFTFQNILSDRTLSKDVSVIPPGTYLEVNPQRSRVPSVRRYWDFEFRSDPGEVRPYEELREQLASLVHDAVTAQLTSDVPLGSFLSGGMDSGTVVAIASSHVTSLPTFTIGFDVSAAQGIEVGFDERRRAEAVSAYFGTDHYEAVLKAGDMERALGPVTRVLEEPRVGQSYPNYYAARLASRFVKVVLSGTGGDELFAGYPWRYYRATGHSTYRSFQDAYFQYWQRLLDDDELPRFFAPIWPSVRDFSAQDCFEQVLRGQELVGNSEEDFINQSLYFEAKTFLPGLLMVEDKFGMAHSIEGRVPFLDNHLVDFAMACPLGAKLDLSVGADRLDENAVGNKVEIYARQFGEGKKILRDVMLQYLPPRVRQMPKQGFSAPDASWFRGSSLQFVRQRLGSPEAPVYQLMDYRVVQDALDEHMAGRRNRRLLIWSLLTVDEHLRQAGSL